MRRYWYLAVAAAVVAALAVPLAASASGAVLTLSPSGNNVSSGDSLTAGLVSGTSAVFAVSSTQHISCSTSNFGATAGSNPTAPGTAAETLTTQTFDNPSGSGNFSDCTTNISNTKSVQSITLNNLPYSVSVTSGSPATLTLSPPSGSTIETTVKIVTNFFNIVITCVYDSTNSTLSGTASNSPTPEISFSSQPFSLNSGKSNNLCNTSATFSASYGPVIDTTQGNQTVLVN